MIGTWPNGWRQVRFRAVKSRVRVPERGRLPNNHPQITSTIPHHSDRDILRHRSARSRTQCCSYDAALRIKETKRYLYRSDLLDTRVNDRYRISSASKSPIRCAWPPNAEENEEKENDSGESGGAKRAGNRAAASVRRRRRSWNRSTRYPTAMAALGRRPAAWSERQENRHVTQPVSDRGKDKLAGRVPPFNVSDPETGTVVRAFGFPTAAEYDDPEVNDGGEGQNEVHSHYYHRTRSSRPPPTIRKDKSSCTRRPFHPGPGAVRW